jgi:hypothetical protein
LTGELTLVAVVAAVLAVLVAALLVEPAAMCFGASGGNHERGSEHDHQQPPVHQYVNSLLITKREG